MSSIFQQTPELRERFIPPTPGEITLLAFHPNVNNGLLDDALCKQIADCGFNAVGATIGMNYVSESIKNCYNNGLSLFFRNEAILQYPSSVIRDYKDKKGLGGWLFRPNLSLSQMDQIASENYECFGNNLFECSYNRVCEYDVDHNDMAPEFRNRNHPIILGISGDWERDNANQRIENYPDYIAKFQEMFRPLLWTYMYFPDLVRPGTDVIPEERRLAFYKDLQYFSYISRYTSTPFWIFVRSMGFDNFYNWEGPNPTEFSVRGIVFSALAYGTQGFLYWNYRPSTDPNVKFSGAPVDAEGNITPFWYRIRMINQEVKAFSDVFYGCEMVDCRHLVTGNPQGLKIFDDPMGPLMKIEKCDEGCSSPERDLLISQIFNKGKDGNGKNYLVIVSDPFTKGCERVTLRFNKYWKVTELKLTTHSEYVEVPIYDDYIHTATLSQGDYLIFSWE